MTYADLRQVKMAAPGWVTNHVIGDELENGRLGDRTKGWLAEEVPQYVINRINESSLKENGRVLIPAAA